MHQTGCSSFKFYTLPPPSMHKWKAIIAFIYKTTNGKSEDQLPTKSSIELKKYSSIIVKVFFSDCYLACGETIF